MAKDYKEAHFQKDLIEDLKAQGFRVKKMMSGMGYTVLDLYVRDRARGAMWIELKTIGSLYQKTGPTPLQQNEIDAELDAGGIAGCIIAIKLDNGDVLAYHHKRGDTHVRESGLLATKKFRGKWDCYDLIDRFALSVQRQGLRKSAV